MRQAWALGILVAATGCATAQPATVPDLAPQLRALTARQVELERKLDRIEARLELLRPRATASAPAPAATAARNDVVVPNNLATVRLAPSAKKAPPVPTAVALKEPDAKTKDDLLSDADAPRGDEAELTLELAADAIRTGDVEHGAAALQRFADKHPRDARAPAALFEAGVGLMTFGDPASATLAFERVADDYPQAEQAPDAMVRLAECQARLKHAEKARDSYAKVVNRYPGTSAARKAEEGLKSLADVQAAAQ